MSELSLLVDRMKSAGALRVYELNQVPAVDPKLAHTVLGLDSGTFVNRRIGGGTDSRARRITAQCFGPTWEAVTAQAEFADQAFEDATLTELDGDPYCIRELSTPPTRDPDLGGVLYILHTYRY